MKLSLCNEVIAPGRDFAQQCALAAALGYQGLEVAPFTLDAQDPTRLSPSRIAQLRATANDAGIHISSLHWLLAAPQGLSITSPDAVVRSATLDALRRLIDLCAGLGGNVLVHGSPAQRRLPDGDTTAARARAHSIFEAVAEHAQDAGMVYCIEPLAPPASNYINTVAEADVIVQAIGKPAFRAMLDCSAATKGDTEPPALLIDRWLPGGTLAHVHVNDSSRRGPGQGTDRFAPVIEALSRHSYAGWIAAEPFDYHPDGATCAARTIGYLQGLIEATT